MIALLAGIVFYYLTQEQRTTERQGGPLVEEIEAPAEGNARGEATTKTVANETILGAPPGYSIEIFADLSSPSFPFPGPNNGPRLLKYHEGDLYVAVPAAGTVYVFKGLRKGNAEVFADGLERPHGLDFFQGKAFIAEETRISSVEVANGTARRESYKVVVSGLPAGGHWTKSVLVKDGKLYVSVGSSCNVCIESDERRAAGFECTLDGACHVVASGLPHLGSMTTDSKGRIWGVEMGRDWLGDDLPPDEVVLIEKGKFYGWPYCYGDNVAAPEYPEHDCSKYEKPKYNIDAHSAPISLRFYENGNDLLVTYHGSWNSSVPKGYKVARVDLEKGTETDFLTGFLQQDVLGRPAGIEVAPNGDVFVSDDKAGKVYRLYK